MTKCLMVILVHAHRPSLEDLVANIQKFCPDTDLLLYNSGLDTSLCAGLGVQQYPLPRILEYARIMPFFFDVFEWFAAHGTVDYLMNLETDMLFVRPGFLEYVGTTMRQVDYMAPNFARCTSFKSKWRPFRSLRPELGEWLATLDMNYTNSAFSPGQLFSKKYVEALLTYPKYTEIRRLTGANRSYTLQEVLLPTLADVLGVYGQSYPVELRPAIRYRPYQAVSGVLRALGIPTCYFVHPVRREYENAARTFVRTL